MNKLIPEIGSRSCIKCKSFATTDRRWYKYEDGYLCHKCYCKIYINQKWNSVVDREMKPCACGCGELIPDIAKRGESRKFKVGHCNRGSLNWLYKGHKYDTEKGYVLVFRPHHPYAKSNGYIREHRLVMEQHLGRYLDPKEVVHHINGNKKDNRIENLELYETHKVHIHLCHLHRNK